MSARSMALALLALSGVGCLSVPSNASRAASGGLTRPPLRGESVPVARPAPGKSGFVLSPYTKRGEAPQLIDVRNVPSGVRVPDPYSGRYFEIP